VSCGAGAVSQAATATTKGRESLRWRALLG
jgi:hypothetical protein